MFSEISIAFLEGLGAVPVLQGKPGAYRQSATAGREDLRPEKLDWVRRSVPKPPQEYATACEVTR